jgi:Nicastrin small lobe
LVIEEDLMPQMLNVLNQDVAGEGQPLPSVPGAIIVLPRDERTGFSPAPQVPLMQYQAQEGQNHLWNPRGKDLLSFPVPCGVFLAPKNDSERIRESAQQNMQRVRTAAHSAALLCMPALLLPYSVCRATRTPGAQNVLRTEQVRCAGSAVLAALCWSGRHRHRQRATAR